jgi:cyclopropane fatty-acyl-phospholipid synthase-like methyltransferase
MHLSAAENALLEWTTAANALALLTAMQTSGALGLLRDPTTPEVLASRVGTEPEQAKRVCMALEALQVVRREGSKYQLTQGWAAIAADDRPAALGDRLTATQPLQRALAGCFDPPRQFDEVAADEAVAMARSVWGVPTSQAALESWAALDAAMPEVRSVWQAGARHAEFGCGAGRDLLRVVAMYPKVSAVGYEMLPYVLDHARQLARDLAIEDRVEFRCQDFLTTSAEAEWDTIVWSQMFFAPEVRPAAIAIIKRALRPGGLLIMQAMADLPEPEAIDPSLSLRAQLLVAVAYRRWNLYWPRAADLRAELEQSGFSHLHTVPHPRTTFMVLRLDG